MMKALSIKQPWAKLILEGEKDVENRFWRRNILGRIYVHTPIQPDIEALENVHWVTILNEKISNWTVRGSLAKKGRV